MGKAIYYFLVGIGIILIVFGFMINAEPTWDFVSSVLICCLGIFMVAYYIQKLHKLYHLKKGEQDYEEYE